MPNFSATTPLTCRPFPPHPATVNPHLPINHDRHKSVGLGVLELHDLMPLSCQLSPSARLLWILLNGFEFPPVHREGYCPEPMSAGAADGHGLSVDIDGVVAHHL